MRPELSTVTTGVEFDRWYWSKAQLSAACDRLSLPKSGSRAELRERVRSTLSGLPLPPVRPALPKSAFNWSQEVLSHDTRITEDIRFGPNVRKWFAAQIGPRFTCHSDFMDWVKGNLGATLDEAVTAWWVLDSRYDDPNFRREIAGHNSYLRYLRDIRDANPDMSLDLAKAYWHARKIMPAQGGIIIYSSDDLALIPGTA